MQKTDFSIMEDNLMKTLSRIFGFLLLLNYSFAQNVLVSDFPVSDVTNASVYRPALAVAPNGSYVVTWGDSRLGTQNRTGGEGDIYARLLGVNGTPLTSNFKVDNVSFTAFYSDFSIFFSSPTFTPSGQLFIIWHVHGVSAIGGIQSDDVYYSAFSGTGQRLAADVQLNMVGKSTGGMATRPNVAFRSPSTFLAVYEYSKNGANIGGTLVDISSGALLGDAFEMSDNAFNNRIYPRVSSNGNYTVTVWTDSRTDAKGDIWSERIVGNQLASSNVKVNDDPAGGYNEYASVAMDAQGNYVVVWIDTRSNAGGDLYGQRFDAQGNKIRSNFKLTKSNSKLWEYPPGIAMKSDGSYVVTWADDVTQTGNNFTAKTRFFSSTDQPLSDVIQVTTAPSAQPDVKIGATGAVIYAWNDGRENVNLGRIYSKIYAGFPTTAVEENNAPLSFRLDQNYPNPFNPTTTISYHLSAQSHVVLKVTDILGREIVTLVNEQKAPGLHNVQWNALQAPSGIYLCRLEAESNVATRKLLLVK
jgi:hypothetical protein